VKFAGMLTCETLSVG